MTQLRTVLMRYRPATSIVVESAMQAVALKPFGALGLRCVDCGVPSYKYADKFARCPDDCPPDGLTERDKSGFHFVFDRLEDPRCFRIPADRDPARFEETPECAQCALSMFSTEGLARAFYSRKLGKHRKFAILLGTHLAEVSLTRTHGKQTEENGEGHFALFEYEGVDLRSCAQMLGPLP